MLTRPNILFIMADQFRADALGLVNGWTRTPNLDRLATEGVLFTNVISNSPECIPARFSLATGLYPHQTGVWQNSLATLNPDYPNWMQAVEHAGYRTSLFGKTHLHPHRGDLRDRKHLLHAYGLQTVDETAGPRASMSVLSNMTQYWQEQGIWDAYRRDLEERFSTKAFTVRPSVLTEEHFYDVYVARQACHYLASYQYGEPWFCWVSFGGPHEPWDAPEPYDRMYADLKMPAPTPRLADHASVGGLLRRVFDLPDHSPDLRPEEVSALRANYAGKVTLIDDQIGRILQTVKQRGDLEDTLIVFTSDHGEMNGDQGLIYKQNFLQPAIAVPLVVWGWPDPPGGTLGRPLEAMTVPRSRQEHISASVELMDVGATIADCAGAPQHADCRARSLRPLLERVATKHRDFSVTEFVNHTCLVDERWKVEFGPDDSAILLFDRAADPQEQVNLVHDHAYVSTIDELRQRLQAFRRATPPPAMPAAILEAPPIAAPAAPTDAAEVGETIPTNAVPKGQVEGFLRLTEGATSIEEGLLLYELARGIREGCIVEVGSWRGRSTVALGRGSIDGARIPVYAIEPHETFAGVLGAHFGPADRGAFYKAMLDTGCFHVVRLINLSSEQVTTGWRLEVRLLWLDGDHRYDGVRRDFESWAPHLAREALVVFDDADDVALGPFRLIGELLSGSGYCLERRFGKITVLRRVR